MNLRFVQLLQGVCIVLLSPLISGGVRWSRAFWQGRRRHWGYIFQPYRDLYKLIQVPMIRPDTASWVFVIAPAIILAIYITLVFTLPVLVRPLLPMNLLMMIYVLGLARFVLSVAGWDTGGSFGSLGGSREMFLHVLIEISLFASIFPLAIYQRTLVLSDILSRPVELKDICSQVILLSLIPALGGAFILEAERSPVGSQESHLELTMSGKAVSLEFSGIALMLLEIGEEIRLAFLLIVSARFLAILLPWRVRDSAMILMTAGYLFSLLGLLGWWEASRPKIRLSKVHFLTGFIALWAETGVLLALVLCKHPGS